MPIRMQLQSGSARLRRLPTTALRRRLRLTIFSASASICAHLWLKSNCSSGWLPMHEIKYLILTKFAIIRAIRVKIFFYPCSSAIVRANYLKVGEVQSGFGLRILSVSTCVHLWLRYSSTALFRLRIVPPLSRDAATARAPKNALTQM